VELFAATSFSRIATRRTSETDAFSAPRMRTPRGPSRTLWSLHRTVPISDVPFVTRRHTRVEFLFARCAVRHRRVIRTFMRVTEAGAELTCWSEDPASPWRYSHQDGPEPENAFHRIASSRAFTHERRAWKNLYSSRHAPAPFRLLPIRAPASAGATDFLRTSALFDHHPTLRSTGVEDARCVQPTSATQTKTCTRTSCVPDSLRSFRCVDAPRRLRLRRTLGDSKVSRPSRSLRRTDLGD
jgi:hypothetical protein